MKRRERGFERIGTGGVEDLGIPARQARALLLGHAWRSVAGEALAQRARAVRLQRGTLEIAVEDRAWADGLLPLIPRLAARLAASHPELGVKRFRVRVGGADAAPSRSAPVEPADEPNAGAEARSAPVEEPASGETEPPEHRLRQIARRYVERSKDPREPDPD